MKIGNVEIKGKTALAPMAGVADTAMRTLCREFGASFVVGEMASAKGICMDGEKSEELLLVSAAERPMAIQLFGSEPDVMAEAARRSLKYKPDWIDLNMGCPAPKVTSNGSGSALMRNPALAGRIIESVVKAVELPVTVKIRKGWDEERVNAAELAHIAQESGAAAVAVHGRTRAQQYAPPVDLSVIADVRRAVNIPVIGNGDVCSPQSAGEMLDRTGCDLVMIGRGALGNPWIFFEIETFLRDGVLPDPPSLSERMDVMRRHIRLMCRVKGERIGMREARKHAAWYLKGMRGAAALREEAGKLETADDLERLIEKALSQGE